MTVTTAKPAGRRRDESRDAAILDATVEVLAEVGYDLLTIDAVAARAKASKATVYRRWDNKAGLVVDAIQRMKAAKPAVDSPQCYWPDTGSLRDDLVAGVSAFVERLNSDEAKVLAAVVTAQMRDPELATAMREATYDDKRRSCRVLADRAIARGELTTPAGADTFVEVLPAILFNRLLITGEPLDDAFITHVVDDIALPLLTRNDGGGRP